VEEQNLPPAQQKGRHPGSKYCKDQLMISKAKCEEQEFLYSLDYQKAFDSIPHSWVEKSTELVAVELLDFVNYQWRNVTQGFI